ncbi:ABC transporter ATP-binding protein [Paenibacillus piri]|uniref:ABC transporter ATP-binding protein n=1 Tax=Paenibacillus piri TaxID=2547395 RepID=A0A4R5KKV4_9BACL|nr:ABC transporter ATP-binding protein [Paenibacillus piri]TDF95478.1 ABC transporter ATP-binding protein [Paenibacillus piri]
MANIRFENVRKLYGDHVIIDNLNFEIHSGERLVLLGPSGCGKSTILRMIAGLENVTEGHLYMRNERVNDIPPGKRNVGMVFQNYALYPHMTVKENITYGLKVKKVPTNEIEKRLDAAADFLQLKPYYDRKPSELSGGQRQRVALARSTVKNSDYFLLDEPLSNLDAQLRISARTALMDIHNQYKQTMVYVTHDQIEAMTFGTRIALLNKGVLQMLDTPENVYHRPANIFTAKFIGNPPANILENVEYTNGILQIGKQSIQLSDYWKNYVEKRDRNQLVLGIRPEHLQLSKTPIEGSIRAKVKHSENQGSNFAIHLDVEGVNAIAIEASNVFKDGEEVFVNITMDQIHFFDKETENNIGYPENIILKKSQLSNRRTNP